MDYNSEMGNLRLRLLTLALAFFFSAGACIAQPEPNYVVFSIMGPQAFGPKIVNGIVQPQSLWSSTEKKAVEEIRKAFGEQRPGQSRYVGFSVCLTPTLNLTIAELKAEVIAALDLSERNKIPVFFHLDDEHFMWANPEFLRNSDMAEWSDFPKPGQSRGPLLRRYWLNWGDPAGVYPVPPLCFACHPLRTIMSQRLRECVAAPIVQRLSQWKKQGKEYLFAGVASGNETKVPDFSRAYEGYSGPAGAAGGMDMTRFPPEKVRMEKDEMVPNGYHSLSVMGYDRQSIEKLAQSQHKSINWVTHELFFKVAQDYAEFQAKTLNQAGLPKDRIYTHFTSTNYTTKPYEVQMQESEARAGATGRYGSDNMAPPVKASVNQFSRPGFTVVSSGVDLDELLSQLQKAGAPEGGRDWAAVESYACTGQPGTPQTQAQYQQYLGGLQSHGAKVVNCYGWNIPSGPYAVKSSGVIPAVKAWSSGKSMPSSWSRSEDLARQRIIQSKVAKLQQSAHDLVESGHDPHPVKAILESFQAEVEPLMKNGRLSEAESCIDRAIGRLQSLK